jgi:hypothetical protein
MARITVSYRRTDSDAITGRIFDRLVAHYGGDAVFRDVDNIPPGIDYRKYITGALESTDILLAIVGPRWIGPKPDGSARIQQETDLVRIEVETALRKDIPVVPVLVGNATMPQPIDLPVELQDFAFRHAVRVDALEDFDDHVKRLIRSLDRLLKNEPSPTQQWREPRKKDIQASEGVAEAQRSDVSKHREEKAEVQSPDVVERRSQATATAEEPRQRKSISYWVPSIIIAIVAGWIAGALTSSVPVGLLVGFGALAAVYRWRSRQQGNVAMPSVATTPTVAEVESGGESDWAADIIEVKGSNFILGFRSRNEHHRLEYVSGFFNRAKLDGVLIGKWFGRTTTLSFKVAPHRNNFQLEVDEGYIWLRKVRLWVDNKLLLSYPKKT